MPSEKILIKKKEFVSSLSDDLNNAIAGVLVDYRGINVENDTKLRRELRDAGVTYIVVKNTILNYVIKNVGLDGLSSFLTGTTAIGFSNTDPIITAKILTKYSDNSKGSFKIKAGFVDKEILSETEVFDLGKIPSKEILIAKALGSLNSPICGFVNVLNANILGLVNVLDAISKKSA